MTHVHQYDPFSSHDHMVTLAASVFTAEIWKGNSLVNTETHICISELNCCTQTNQQQQYQRTFEDWLDANTT